MIFRQLDLHLLRKILIVKYCNRSTKSRNGDMKIFERQFLVLIGNLALSVDLDQGLAQLEPFAVYHWLFG